MKCLKGRRRRVHVGKAAKLNMPTEGQSHDNDDDEYVQAARPTDSSCENANSSLVAATSEEEAKGSRAKILDSFPRARDLNH